MRDWSTTMSKWSLEESRRLLYVALTRARESLLLSATADLEEGLKPESFLGFLGLDLNSGDHETYKVLSSSDLKLSHLELTRTENVAPSIRLPWIRARELAVCTKSSQMVSISVSQLLEMESEAAEATKKSLSQIDLKPDIALRMADAAARGTRLHRVFEMAKSSSKVTQDLMVREITRWFPEKDQPHAMEALRWVLELQSPEISAVLANGEVEWSFTYKAEAPTRLQEKLKGAIAIEGQIDLWGRDSAGQLWVLDYKTGSSAYVEKALRQLEYYAAALIAGGIASPSEPIELAALFPFSKEVFTRTWTGQ